MPDDNKLVMIIDDDLNLTKMLKFLFSTRGFTVHTAVNGIEALEMLKKDMPDAIILDILMPEMDGLEFMGKIKADSLTKEVPVVVLTAAELEESNKRLLSAGAYYYMEKPFKSEDLVSRVAGAIEARGV